MIIASTERGSSSWEHPKLFGMAHELTGYIERLTCYNRLYRIVRSCDNEQSTTENNDQRDLRKKEVMSPISTDACWLIT